MHPRRVIRAKVVELLIAGATAAADRVYPTRVVPHRRGSLPVLSVYTLEETVDPESANTAPRELTRDVTLRIEGWVQAGAEAVDDQLDDLAEEVEAIMEIDPFLDGTCVQSVLAETETEVIQEGDRLIGVLLMAYTVTYRTYAPDAAGSGLDDFEIANAKYEFGAPVDPDAPKAEDTITVQP